MPTIVLLVQSSLEPSSCQLFIDQELEVRHSGSCQIILNLQERAVLSTTSLPMWQTIANYGSSLLRMCRLCQTGLAGHNPFCC